MPRETVRRQSPCLNTELLLKEKTSSVKTSVTPRVNEPMERRAGRARERERERERAREGEREMEQERRFKEPYLSELQEVCQYSLSI